MSVSIAERNCQNCGADLTDTYCPRCGQKKTAVYDKSVSSLMKHFVEEFFTWDSRFFLSMKYLFTRPGYLTHEYISGRIQRYTSPIKLFLFTSLAIFFILIKTDPDNYKSLVTEATTEDDFFKEFILEQQSKSNEPDELFIDNFNEEINGNITLYLFIIMFVFSVLLEIVYFTKHIYYAEHIVFTLHFFTFVLWCLLFSVIVQGLSEYFFYFFLFILPGIYLLIALKSVYHKTLWKAIIVCSFLTFCYWILVFVWVIGTVMISAVKA
jgi:hypothetical protein